MTDLSHVDDLNRQFGISGLAKVLSGNGGLPRLVVKTKLASAEIYLHGAQFTSWQPAGVEEVIFLSRHSYWEEGRAIRGGIPVCFPWFRAKADDPQAPAHGFVRTKAWQLKSLVHERDVVTVTLSTESDAGTRRWWPHEFRLEHRITVGAELKLELIVSNTGSTEFRFEEALHTYYKVGDAGKICISGLDGTTFLDNTDANHKKTQHGDVVMTRPIDNAYIDTTSALELIDPIFSRRIQIAKENSHTT